jgi:hypothetical protein
VPPLDHKLIKLFPERVLFYIFYNFAFEKITMDVAKELEIRGWKYLS